MLRIALAGSVGSSRLTLAVLIRHKANLVGVLEFRPQDASAISDYTPLHDLSEAAGIPCVGFANINDEGTVAAVRRWNPDLLFVVGLSQLVRAELLSVPKIACVGFHPTRLPQGRGRAPIAWLTLDGGSGAATFFVLEAGADAGPILAQEPFPVSSNDYASEVVRASSEALERALDRWLPRLLAGEWDPQPQDGSQATYNGKRGPEDGLIDWHAPAAEIHALVRAASRPHPGAYTYADHHKLLVWRAELEERYPIRGVPGRVLQLDDAHGALVQSGGGLLWLTETEWDDATQPAAVRRRLRVGDRLGLVVEDEIHSLRQRVAALEQRLRDLQASGGSLRSY